MEMNRTASRKLFGVRGSLSRSISAPAHDGMGGCPNWPSSAVSGRPGSPDMSILHFLESRSQVEGLCGIGGRRRRLQRPGVVFLIAITRKSKMPKSTFSRSTSTELGIGPEFEASLFTPFTATPDRTTMWDE